MHKVSILGCGWLGLAIAKKLKTKYQIICSSATKNSQQKIKKFTSIVLNSSNLYKNSSFFNTNTLIIAIPPKNNYLNNLKLIAKNIQSSTQVILISSTSVYSSLKKEYIKEEDTQYVKNPNIMLQGELLMQKHLPNIVILRAGGLMGNNRIAGKYSAGKELENRYVNYIHQNDATEAIAKIIEQKTKAKIYNLVAPLNATREETFNYTAKKYGFAKTTFTNKTPTKKIILSTKIEQELNFNFKYASIKQMF
jgi:nucleoside-diphosphate-sugar epimerase